MFACAMTRAKLELDGASSLACMISGKRSYLSAVYIVRPDGCHDHHTQLQLQAARLLKAPLGIHLGAVYLWSDVLTYKSDIVPSLEVLLISNQ